MKGYKMKSVYKEIKSSILKDFKKRGYIALCGIDYYDVCCSKADKLYSIKTLKKYAKNLEAYVELVIKKEVKYENIRINRKRIL